MGGDADNRFLTAVLHHMEARADQVFSAFIHAGGEREIRWGDLRRRTAGFATAYRQGAAGGEGVVLIFLRHTPDLYASFLGAMFAGLTPSFMPCTSPRQDPGIYWSSHAELVAAIRPAAVVAEAETFAEMRAAGLDLGGATLILPGEVADGGALDADLPGFDQAAMLQHSSGTTGLKKGVVLSYRAIVAQLESYAEALALNDDDCIVSWLPLYHDMGLLACFVLPVFAGVRLVHMDPFDWLARPAWLFAQIEARRGTLAWLPNFAFEHLANTVDPSGRQYDLSSMRAFIDCSEPCRQASLERFAATFAPFGLEPSALQICYAMAETVFAVTQTSLGGPLRYLEVDRARLEIGAAAPLVETGTGSPVADVGPPIRGAHVTIRGSGGAVLPDGAVGEVAIAADFLFTGYNKDPMRSEERLRDGWYYTRDLGFQRDGGLFVLGRLDDVIIVNGKNLLAHDIEAIVSTIEGVKPGRAVAVAVFDVRNGSDVLVVMAETLGETVDPGLRRAVVERIYAHTGIKPYDVRLVGPNSLIKTSSGKMSRKDNRQRYLDTVGV